ncbi:YARHG domain-containing protein, partial [candidate division WOR-3 bacterium]|nr:YARHG domain-containing protein [candidate division WOR-3 bacterium]
IKFQPHERKIVYVKQKVSWYSVYNFYFSFPEILQIDYPSKFVYGLKLESLWAGTPERIDIYYEFWGECNIEDKGWQDTRHLFIQPKGYYWLNNHTLAWRIEDVEPKEDIVIKTASFSCYDTKNDIIKDWVGNCAEEVSCVDYCEPDFHDEPENWYEGNSKLYTEDDLNLWKDVDIDELKNIPCRYKTYKAVLEAYPELMRNVIYAVHGYPFKTPFWRSNFEEFAWYEPREDFSDAVLNEIEHKNIAFILEHEKKIKEYLEKLEKEETATRQKREKGE